VGTTFAGERLRTARSIYGLTQNDVAHLAGISQPMVSGIENGSREASAETLVNLCRSLGLPHRFFEVVPEHLPLDSLRFRKYSTSSVTDTGRAIALFGEAYRFASAVLSEAEYPVPDLPVVQGEVDEDRLVSLAAQTRESLRLGSSGPIPHVTRALERVGIAVAPIVLPTKEPQEDSVTPGHFGLSYWPGVGEPALVGYFPGGRPDRDRFTLAHELAHVVLHVHRRQSSDPEAEANLFASEFLMPRDRAIATFGDGDLTLRDFARLKAVWGLSIQALIMRAGHVGAIDEERKRSLFKQLSARGWRKNEPVSVRPEEPLLLRTLLTRRWGVDAFRRAEEEFGLPGMIIRSLVPSPAVRSDQSSNVLEFGAAGQRPRTAR
jgi:Zn-dependent peptidase ImmA (M78 family)/transcriptional regulator with XRE-family HTH domain